MPRVRPPAPGWDAKVGTQTWTLFDLSSGDPIMDFNNCGSLTMRYLWGPTGIVARQTSGGTVSWYLADALGTVRDLINNSGAVIDHVDFSAFGTVLDESSPTSGDRFVSFAGLERDTVTGLNLAVEREENPGTGRWDSRDPAAFGAGDTNLYRYVLNNPALYVDWNGTDLFAPPIETLPNPLGWLWDHTVGTWPWGTAIGLPLTLGGQPTKPKPGASLGGPKGTVISPKTSPISSWARKHFPQTMPRRPYSNPPSRLWPAPTNMGWRQTAKVGTFVGRWAPYVGWILRACDVISIFTSPGTRKGLPRYPARGPIFIVPPKDPGVA
jgi:RHS repeat-associated protein